MIVDPIRCYYYLDDNPRISVSFLDGDVINKITEVIDKLSILSDHHEFHGVVIYDVQRETHTCSYSLSFYSHISDFVSELKIVLEELK